MESVRDADYIESCKNCSSLFGCISLRNKKYCIFNKQYTKEKYDKLIPQIIEHMKKTREYGEFFPPTLSPFPYKVTQAYEFFPLDEQQAKDKGFIWYEIAQPAYEVTLQNKNIPDNVHDAERKILDEIIECEHKGNCEHECTDAFRIIERELEFLKRMNIS